MSDTFPPKISIKTFIAKSRLSLQKHNTTKENFNRAIIENIVYDGDHHIVSAFKDFLLWDENSEFLRRLYMNSESTSRIPKIAEYYSSFTFISPNYGGYSGLQKIMKKFMKKKRKIYEKLQEIEDDNQSQNIEQNIYSTLIQEDDVNSIELKGSELFNENTMNCNLQLSNVSVSDQTFENSLTIFETYQAIINPLNVKHNSNNNTRLIINDIKNKKKKIFKKVQNNLKMNYKSNTKLELKNKQEAKSLEKGKKPLVQEKRSIRNSKIILQNNHMNIQNPNSTGKNKKAMIKEFSKIQTPQMISNTPVIAGSKISNSKGSNTSRNNIISPSFLKVNLTKESLGIEKKGIGKFNANKNTNKIKSKPAPTNIVKNIQVNNQCKDTKNYWSNKEEANSRVALINKILTPIKGSELNMKAPKDKTVKTSKDKKLEIPNGSQKSNQIVNQNHQFKTNPTTLNINLNGNSKLNFNCSSKLTSSNSTLKNTNLGMSGNNFVNGNSLVINTNQLNFHNGVNSFTNTINNIKIKKVVNDLNIRALSTNNNSKKNLLKTYNISLNKFSNTPTQSKERKTDSSIKTNELNQPLTDRGSSPKENLLKNLAEKSNKSMSKNRDEQTKSIRKEESKEKEKKDSQLLSKNDIGKNNKIISHKNYSLIKNDIKAKTPDNEIQNTLKFNLNLKDSSEKESKNPQRTKIQSNDFSSNLKKIPKKVIINTNSNSALGQVKTSNENLILNSNTLYKNFPNKNPQVKGIQINDFNILQNKNKPTNNNSDRKEKSKVEVKSVKK